MAETSKSGKITLEQIAEAISGDGKGQLVEQLKGKRTAIDELVKEYNRLARILEQPNYGQSVVIQADKGDKGAKPTKELTPDAAVAALGNDKEITIRSLNQLFGKGRYDQDDYIEAFAKGGITVIYKADKAASRIIRK